LIGATCKDAYPLLRTDACLDAMSGTCWFATFDMRSSYHQVAMSSEDADKTAFITRRAMFHFRIKPLACAMRVLLSNGWWICCWMDTTWRSVWSAYTTSLSFRRHWSSIWSGWRRSLIVSKEQIWG